MKTYEEKLTDEEVKKVEEKGTPYCLFSKEMLMGCGVYAAKIIEKDGEKYLWYKVGESCD